MWYRLEVLYQYWSNYIPESKLVPSSGTLSFVELKYNWPSIPTTSKFLLFTLNQWPQVSDLGPPWPSCLLIILKLNCSSTTFFLPHHCLRHHSGKKTLINKPETTCLSFLHIHVLVEKLILCEQAWPWSVNQSYCDKTKHWLLWVFSTWQIKFGCLKLEFVLAIILWFVIDEKGVISQQIFIPARHNTILYIYYFSAKTSIKLTASWIEIFC